MDVFIGNIKYNEEFILNARGNKLFTCSWVPQNQEPKALIFICHGYAMECSITMNSTATRLANAGFACYGIDYEGHGKSSGLDAYISNFDDLVDDCSNHFTNICERKENREKKRYFLGESMGGSVALILHKRNPDYWDGAVLVAPMCKLADDLRPSPFAISVLTQLCKVIPTWKLIPTQDIVDIAFKVPEIRKQIRGNQYCYKGRPRLKTGQELQRICMELEQNLHKIAFPFLVLHGEDDRVADPATSKQLYDVASSIDKTLKMYSQMWHGLLYGEPLENIEIVFRDIIDWLDQRVSKGNSTLESKLKQTDADSKEHKDTASP